MNIRATLLKYGLATVPAILGLGASLYSGSIHPRDPLAEPGSFRTPAILDYLSEGWVVVGLTVSGVLLVTVLIDDMYNGLRSLWSAQKPHKGGDDVH